MNINTTNTSLISDTPYEIASLDRELWFTVPQILFLIYCFAFIVSIDFKLISTIWRKPELQIQGNILICCILVIDFIDSASLALHLGITITLQTFLLSQDGCRSLYFYYLALTWLKDLLFTIAAIEKFCYMVYPLHHNTLFAKKKLFSYIAISIFIAFCFHVVYYSFVDLPADFSTFIYGCYVHDDAVTLTIYIVFASSFGLEGIFQAAIFIFSMWKYFQMRHQHVQPADKSIFYRMCRNALGLFVITLLRCENLLIYCMATITSMHFIIGRLLVLYYITALPVCQPLIVILGNVQIRKAIKDLGKVNPSINI